MENIRPLFTKIVDEAEFKENDMSSEYEEIERNPFNDSAYLKKITDHHRESGHFSLIPRALQEQHMSDFECNSQDDQMDYYPFCAGQNYILSQQPSQLNFHPAPRHSLPERFMHL